MDSSAALLRRWINAFNMRDLDGMLTLMHADVRLHPLRLNGLERSYRGHDGIRKWFARLRELGLGHRLAVSNVRADGDKTIAIGTLRLEPGDDPVRFWILDQIEDGLIVSANHYLTDPDAFPWSSRASPGT